MSGLRSWFKGSASNTTSKGSSMASTPQDAHSRAGSPGLGEDGFGPGEPACDATQRELSDLADSMEAASLIMNDDIEGAEARLRVRADASTFHQLGMGVAIFMRSILGFEKDIMLEAATRLNDTEARACADMKRAQREAEKAAGGGGGWLTRGGGGGGGAAAAANGRVGGRVSSIYPPGTEFALVHAEALLMNAVIGVMQESLTEGLKGFYKLRKAFIALNGIIESEAQYLASLENDGAPPEPGASDGNMTNGLLKGPVSSETSTEENSANAAAEASEPPAYLVLDKFDSLSDEDLGGRSKKPQELKLNGHNGDKDQAPLRTPPPARLSQQLGTDTALFKTPVDVFIHSGANMFYGLLLVIISMVPPAFSRFLYIIGFKGDREQGVKMLWQSTKFSNINGAIAGLAILGYYNGLLGFADILPTERDMVELAAGAGDDLDDDDAVVGYPRARCEALLADMCARFPESRLWKLEQARVLANTRRVRDAIALLQSNSDSRMRQITALNNFELSMNALYVLDWDLMREGFVRSVDLNDWSHAIYYYLAGAAELELYRDAFHHAAELAGDDETKEERLGKAAAHKTRAEAFFRKVPATAGRKRFMSRNMPMEVFVVRKLQKWEERARTMGPGGVDLADAVGASPALEMAYVWNGIKRMGETELARARGLVGWERCTADAEGLARLRGEKDEAAVQAVLESALLRSLGMVEEAREATGEVVAMDRYFSSSSFSSLLPAPLPSPVFHHLFCADACLAALFQFRLLTCATPRHHFKGATKDDYALPSAHYEVAVAAWLEASQPRFWPADRGADAVEAFRRDRVDACQAALDRVAKWETFVLDARIGLRVSAGLSTVKWLKEKKGWA